MSKTLICLPIFISLALCFSPFAFAGSVTVPVSHYPPWKITENQKEPTGINIELTKFILNRLGLTPDFAVRPGKRCLYMMEKGGGDLMSGLLKSPDRQKYLIYIYPPYKTKSKKAFYVLKGDSHRINDYGDLENVSIGTVLGAKYFTEFDNDTKLHKQAVKTNQANLHKLLRGRIDTFICTETVADYLIAKEHVGNLVEKAHFSYDRPVEVYFAVSKLSELAGREQELSNAVQELIESGHIQSTINKYMSDVTEYN